MHLDALRYFLAVVEARSVRGAADDLHIAQSALSRQIAALEREFGAPLLTRMARGVQPTEAGIALARRARSALDQLASARDEIGAIQGLHSGRVSLATIEPVADSLLPGCMARLLKSHPGISFDIRVANSRQAVALLREGVVELAMAYNAPGDRELAVRAQVTVPLVALVRRGHELDGAGSCGLGELLRWPLVLPPAGSPTRLLIDEAARRDGVHVERVALESDSVAMRLAFLDESDAVAILARISGRMKGSSRSVAAIRIENAMLEAGTLQLLVNRGHQLSRAAAEFERLVSSAMRRSRQA